jgi:transposase-like protein
MTDRRKSFTAELKTKVALEAIKGNRTVSEIASAYGVHPHQITQWKKLVMEGLPDILSDRRRKRYADQEELLAQLYQQIGQLKVELDWVKKKSGISS